MTHSEGRHFDTIIVGGGQAGLATGHFLAQQRRDFVILDAERRVGDAWRNRWDSLRLFTPAKMSSLPGAPLLSNDGYFATKDELADYLEAYANSLQPVLLTNTRVRALRRDGDGFTLESEGRWFTCHNVIVATGPFHIPAIPAYDATLDPSIVRLHSSDYRNPRQLPDGPTLVVGAGNSGAEIAVELANTGRQVWLAGRDTGHLSAALRSELAQLIFGKLFTTETAPGRAFKARASKIGAPLISLTAQDIARAGVVRTTRVTGVKGGRPELADGRTLEVASVIWATGYHREYDWIDLPIFDEQGSPEHQRGVVPSVPGLYFVGMFFQYRLASSTIGGVGADAAYIANHMHKHRPSRADISQPTVEVVSDQAADA